MSEAKRVSEVRLSVEGEAETLSRTDEALRSMESAATSEAAAAASLGSFVTRAKEIAQKLEELGNG